MYSKNDYRYYLERRLINDDYLAHERSHKYIKKIGDRYFYTQQEVAAFMNGGRKKADAKTAERIGTNVSIGANETKLVAGWNTPKMRNVTKYRDEQYRGRKRTREEQERSRQAPIKDAQKRGEKRTAQEHVRTDQDRGRKRTEQYKGKSSEYLREYESNSKKNNFPTSKKKKKSNRKPFTIESLRRVKPKGRKLKGGNITVTHNTTIK